MLRKDIEITCTKRDELQSKIFDAEVGYDVLVDVLQEKLIIMLFDNEEEACLEIEDTEEELNE